MEKVRKCFNIKFKQAFLSNYFGDIAFFLLT